MTLRPTSMWALIRHPILSEDPLPFQHGVGLDSKLLCDYENERKNIWVYYSVLSPISYVCNLANFSVLWKMQRRHKKNMISHSYAQFS